MKFKLAACTAVVVTCACLVLCNSSAYAALLAYEGFTEGAGNPTLAGYSGTSEVGLTGAWSEATGQAMTIRDGSGGEWGDPQSYWPAAEHTTWWLTRATRPLDSPVDLTSDGTYYMSFYVGTDQADHGAQIGLSNATNELMAGNGYSGGSRDITAYYGALDTDISTNGNGTAIDGGWSGEMRQYQVVVELARSGGDLDVTVSYYRDAYDGAAETIRTVALGAVSDSFDMLQLKADGWNNVDEFRLGTELSDVADAAVPEPGALALAGLALGSLLITCRR